MATTTYDINVRYQLQDKTSREAERIGTELKKTDRAGRGLLSTIKMIAAGAAVGFGMRAGKKWLIDYNSELEDTKLKMTGLISLNMGGEWATNQKKANALIGQFRVDAISSAGTMQDFAEFAGMITGPILRAGMSMKDLREITKGGVVAAKAFGIEAGMAALDIEQALAGTLTKKDRFARALLEPMGITTEIWNKMATETPELIGKNLVKAFNQPALQQMADAYKSSWSGVTSTLKDNLQQTLGRVGLPLMKTLVKEIKSMNSYFEKNPEKISQFIKDFSEGLITGFEFVKDTIKLIIDNSGTLMSIAKAFLGFKLIQGGAGLLAGPLDMIAKYSKGMGKAGSATMSFSQQATMAANKLQAVGTVLALVYAGASLLAGHVDRSQTRKLKKIEKKPQALLSSAREKQEGTRASRTVNYARDAGILSDTGEASLSKYLSATTGKNFTDAGLKKKFDQWKKVTKTRRQNTATAVYRETGKSTPQVSMSDPRFMEALKAGSGAAKSWQGLLAAIEVDRKRKAADHEQWAKRFGGEIDKAGGLLSLYASQVGNPMFDVTADNRLVGPTGEGEYTAPIPKPTKKNGDVKVYINTIKVAADDPDRFAMRMIGAFKNANTKPVASRIRVPGGRPS